MKKFSIILAIDEKNWIWKYWTLAWRIKEDMEFFKETTIWHDENKQNVVIMWRKTWESIPEKFRPLPNRINCILSRNSSSFKNKEEICFSSLEENLEYFSDKENIWEIFIIWWAEIYKLALESKYLNKIYLTRVFWDFDCDTFVNIDFSKFKELKKSEILEENWIKFEFVFLEKIK